LPIQGACAGEFKNLRWQVVADTELAVPPGEISGEPAPVDDGDGTPERSSHRPLDDVATEKLRATLAWTYPFAAATTRKAKASVTTLRREAEELADEAERVFPATPKSGKRKAESGKPKLGAAETGLAHHKFLQQVALEKTSELTAEADRLVRENYLSDAERAALDLESLADFWNSELGDNIRADAALVRRELPFTARFSPAELEAITGRKAEPGLEEEFVVVQGVADLVLLRPAGIWLVDFKTDAVGKSGLPEKIRAYTPQLQLYAAALEKIFARKVTRRALHFLGPRQTVEI
jgi:ATP-dependent helicase/nuclease subunit A